MFFDGEVLEEVGLIGNERELRLCADRILPQVSSGDPNPAAAGDDDPCQTPNSRGLARAIRPNKPEHLPGSNPERQPLDGGEVTIQLLQPLDFDHWSPWGRR